MTMKKKGSMGLTFLVILISFSYVSANGMDMEGMDNSGMEMGTNMVPFHIAEILMAIVAAVLVSNVITATGQKDVFIYIPIAMVLFALGSVVAYSPHLGMMSSPDAAIGSTTLSIIAMAFLGVSFYKWKKMLG